MVLAACCNCSPCLFTVCMGNCPSSTLLQSMLLVSLCWKPSPLQALWGGSPPMPSSTGLFIYSLCGEVLLPHSWAEYATWGGTPPPYSRAEGAPPSLLCVFFFSCLFIIHFFFCRWGAMLIFLGDDCGRTMYHLLLTCGFAKQVRSWCLEALEPSWFLCILWCGGVMCGLGMWRCWSFASSW
jgi:hypothetical protein